MNNDVNLVAGDIGRASQEARRLNTLKLIATSLIIGVGAVSILLFVLNRVFSSQSIINEQDAVRVSIQSAQAKHAKLTILNQRLNDISSVVSKRASYDIVLISILSQSPSDIQIISLAVDKKKISMIASSRSLISVNNFIEVLAGMVRKKEFLQNVTVNNLSLNSRASSYTLTLELSLL
ncbi:MAG: hypothetical protein WD967_02630 [Candidatus Levyibacteriota bacterium]